MAESYYLFRGDQLVYRNENQDVLGAGKAHALGQEGDVLLHIDRHGHTAFRWHKPEGLNEIPWPVQPLSADEFKRYQTLILLQR